MAVRDYECDLQGIVNKSVYQNYMEHTRHEYLKSIGVDFKEYADRGINLVVIKAELNYKHPLTSGDSFVVRVKLKKESKIKFAFHQDIISVPEGRTVLKGKITGVAVNSSGRPCLPEELKKILDEKE